MELKSIEVEALYEQKIGEHTLRVQFNGRPGKEPHMHIMTSGTGGVGDAFVQIGELEEITQLLKEARDDFVKRFAFKEVK